MSKLMAILVFSGEYSPDVDRAAAELQQAAYTVIRFPDELRATLVHPRDDFLEVFIEGSDEDQVWQETNAIANKYGGLCDECGPMELDHVPFAWARAPRLDA
jgi:hypothetical protein